jgi:hypothetical protein
MTMRYVIPAIGYTPRLRSTFVTSAEPLPPDTINETKEGYSQPIPRWMQGVKFQSVGCEPLERIAAMLCDAETSKVARELGDIIEFDSFTVYDAQKGSLICTDIERVDGDIVQRYPSMVSEQLGNELMCGGVRDESQGANVNPSLRSSAAILAGGPYTPNDALALLEQAAADFLHGGQAMIHMTPRGFSFLNFFDQGSLENNRWLTAQGHIIVADSGYDGCEPDANNIGGDAPNTDADEWWYMSGSVFYALTEFVPLGIPYERIDYDYNQLTSIMEATATVVFDPCAVVAVPVCYQPECLPFGS